MAGDKRARASKLHGTSLVSVSQLDVATLEYARPACPTQPLRRGRARAARRSRARTR